MSETLLLAVKAAWRDLVKAAGGQERAALLTRTSQSRISEAASVAHMDRAPRADHVAVLEADCGVPIVTRMLADRARFTLSPKGVHRTADPHVHLAAIITETAELTAFTAQALADGKVSVAEARDWRRKAQDAITALQALDAQMNGILRGGV